MPLTFKYTREDKYTNFWNHYSSKSSKCEKLVGVYFQNKLKFNTCIENICRELNRQENS